MTYLSQLQQAGLNGLAELEGNNSSGYSSTIFENDFANYPAAHTCAACTNSKASFSSLSANSYNHMESNSVTINPLENPIQKNFETNYSNLDDFAKRLYQHYVNKQSKDCTCTKSSSSRRSSITLGQIVNKYAKRINRLDNKFENDALVYFSNEGKELGTYLKNQGRQAYTLTGIGYASIDNAVAAVEMQGDKARLLGNVNFENKVENLAKSYGVSNELAKRYVLDHEHTHIWQRGMNFDDPIVAERDVEYTLSKFYSSKTRQNPSMASEYAALAKIANHRAASVERNYGGKSSFSYN